MRPARMKSLVLVCFMLASLHGFTQERGTKSVKWHQAVKYIGPSEITGQSDAVIVDEIPLAHTKQFLPVDEKGELSYKGDLSMQTEQAFLNMSKALSLADSGIDQIVKLNVVLQNTDLIIKIQSLLSQKFNAGRKPAITFVAGDLAHPDALIAMDAVAVSGSKTKGQVLLSKSSIHGQGSPVAILPKGPVVYISGQAAKGGLAAATRETLKQLEASLVSMGLNKKDIVQFKSFLSPMSSLPIVEKEFADFFRGSTIPPLVFVDWISNDPVIEIELIAASPIKSAGMLTQVEYLTPPGMTASPVYSKVTRLNYGKKIYMSGIAGLKSENSDTELMKIFNSMKEVFHTSGSDFNHLLKATYYIRNDSYSKSLGDLRPKYYDARRPPAASKAMVKGLGIAGSGISIDMIGTVPESGPGLIE